MGRPGRVVWSEGMALDPQHFQQWDRYHSAVLQARMRSVAPHAWGLTDLQIDEAAIANGTFRLTQCSGVMADGLVFSIPDLDPPPVAREIAAHFSPREERLPVYLAVPIDRVDGINYLLPTDTTQRETRFVVAPVTITDETTGHEPRPIEVARPNLVLKVGNEALQGYTTIKLAEVTRTHAGELAIDERFVPPCLTLSASRALQVTTRRILEQLMAKSTSLWNRTRHLPHGQASLSAGDVMSLLLQQTTNSFIPILNHYQTSAKQHPEALYTTLSILAGQLSAMPGHSEHPRALPAYNHESATACFAVLDATIARLLGGAAPEVNYLPIPLVRRDDLDVAEISDAALLDEAVFFLIASGVAPGTERALPDQLRVAAPAAMPAVRNGFLRALPMEWEPRPPTGAPIGPELQYFRLGKDGQFWKQIRADHEVAIHVPAHVKGLSMQLIAVRQGS
jgi:type VI secretion system protein ImpJ